MAQILDPLPSGESDNILCCYVNSTSQIQVARITNVPNWYFERVVFPGQRLVFEAVPSGMLEIHSGMMASAIISDTIPCSRLCVQETNLSGNAQKPTATNKNTVADRPQEIPEKTELSKFPSHPATAAV